MAQLAAEFNGSARICFARRSFLSRTRFRAARSLPPADAHGLSLRAGTESPADERISHPVPPGSTIALATARASVEADVGRPLAGEGSHGPIRRYGVILGVQQRRPGRSVHALMLCRLPKQEMRHRCRVSPLSDDTHPTVGETPDGGGSALTDQDPGGR